MFRVWHPKKKRDSASRDRMQNPATERLLINNLITRIAIYIQKYGNKIWKKKREENCIQNSHERSINPISRK